MTLGLTVLTINLTGYIPDPKNDQYWSFEQKLLFTLSASTAGSIDLRKYTSPRHNQRKTGTCVAQSVIKALEIKRRMAGKPHVDLSVLHLYFLCRQLMKPPQTNMDKGTHIYLAAHCLRKFGVCQDSLWPFDESKIYLNPGWKPLSSGAAHKIDACYRIKSRGTDRVDSVIAALLDGNPIVYATAVGSNWTSYRKGQVLQLPDKISGWHATVIIGWTGTHFICENSWGTSWGDNGFYLIDPDVIASTSANDFWVIREGYE